ncbi:MAG: hypothetical protein IJQ57_07315 [Synergistaceae bacterium]|nr:hypothetical protein [Synergistaceae bacterium]
MTSNNSLVEMRIEELENLQSMIMDRIHELKAQGNIEEDYDSQMLELKMAFSGMIKDRTDNDDAMTLWEIFSTLKSLEEDVAKALQGLI